MDFIFGATLTLILMSTSWKNPVMVNSSTTKTIQGLFPAQNINPDIYGFEGQSQKGIQESSDVDIFAKISKINQDLGPHRGDIEYGDIATGSSKNAHKCLHGPRSCLWPRNRFGIVYIPYTLDSVYSKSQQAVIHNAMQHFAMLTCIRFVYRQQERNYVRIVAEDGCWSHVGYLKQIQNVSLDKSGCVTRGVIHHELLHTIGFNHEQSRSDRDDYVTILFDNIEDDLKFSFNKLDTNNLGTTYDYSSVMHYDKYAFSKNGNITILPKPDPNVSIGQQYGMATLDVDKVNKLYNCKTCGGLLMKDHELLNSPGFPDLYPNNLHCIWLVRTPNYKNKIFLQFTKFQVEQFINCYSDRVIIYDGESLVSPVLDGPTCGSENPAVVSSGGSLLVEFFSSRIWRAFGFSAKFQFVECGYTLTDKKGNINFRTWKKANSRQRCWWALLMPRAFKIVFTLITLHMSSNGTCTEDYLAIHDVAANPPTLLGKYCGKLPQPVVFTSTGRTLVLELSHPMPDLGWGISAEYKSIINKNPPEVITYNNKGSYPNTLALVLTSAVLYFHYL
ncbi:astacin-like metalloendopeptidase isoform X1 [Mobula birostris]|uniref:astacin-like metalloendopeptidase isoform X1 n=1 Tax=Mobula birostris TaxID=1983395 RepID=UPI003B27C7E2